MRVRCLILLLLAGVPMAVACTNDYASFRFYEETAGAAGEDDGAGGDEGSGGSGGAAGSG